ncbi:MAG TPA: hypothetical protein VFT64_08795 [Rickettsiales bacterium]|nr:hypothetical protein [Rickettsiales bacterium]
MAEANTIAPDTPANEAHSRQSFGQKIWGYAKSRFNSDNWFGSLITACFAYVNYESLLSARTRLVHGKLTRDRPREFSAQVQIAEKVWSFSSARGGMFPEGHTLGQRITNAFLHPQRSSTQFEWLILMPVFMFNNLNHIKLGLKAHGVGLKAGEIAYAPEKIRLYSGLYQLVAQSLKGYGHFRKHNDEPIIEDVRSLSVSGPGGLGKLNTELFVPIKKMWKHDRVFLIGSVLNVFSPAFAGIEAWRKQGRSSVEAKHLARQTAITGLIVAAEGVYGAQRIVKSNYTQKHRADAGGHVARLGQTYPAIQDSSHQERLTSLRQAWKESQEQQL